MNNKRLKLLIASSAALALGTVGFTGILPGGDIPAQADPGDSYPILVEAEDGTLAGKARVEDNPQASGGKVVSWIGGNNGSVTVSVPIPIAGDVDFELQYVANGKQNVKVECEGAQAKLLDLPAGDGAQPQKAPFTCYMHVGINTIRIYNDAGPAPHADAVIALRAHEDGSGGDPQPEPSGPTPQLDAEGNIVDKYADNPGTAMPVSDPDGVQGWTYIPEYSTEFTGTDLSGDYQRFPDEWSWRPEWRWQESNAVVADGLLKVRQTYDPSTTFHIDPPGWTMRRIDLDMQDKNTDTVTSYAARSGTMGLRHTYFNRFGVRNEQVIDLPQAGSYTFTGWVKTEGNDHPESWVRLTASGCEGAASSSAVEIPRNNGQWQQYSLTVTAPDARKCTVGLESTGWTFADVARFDDFTFAGTDGKNLLVNGDFEQAVRTPNASGGVYLTEKVNYGYFETRAQGGTPFPGTCLAYWLDGREGEYSTEIDIVELGEKYPNPYIVDFAAHKWPSSALGPNHQSNGGNTYTAPWDPSQSFHTYGLEWAPGVQKWYVDGVLAAVRTDPAFDPAEQILILSLGLRSPYVADPDRYQDLFAPDAVRDNVYDYSRVWKRQALAIDDAQTGDYQHRFNFDSNWQRSAETGLTSAGAGATFALRFDGDAVALTGERTGTVAYRIDDGAEVEIDHSAVAADLPIFASQKLARGKHVLTARVVSGTVAIDGGMIYNTGVSEDIGEALNFVTPAPVTVTAEGKYLIPEVDGVH